MKGVEVSGPQGGAMAVGYDLAAIQRIVDRIAEVKARRAEWQKRKP
ncbi:hypothetical protein [Streptosporangium sp. NPDC006007]